MKLKRNLTLKRIVSGAQLFSFDLCERPVSLLTCPAWIALLLRKPLVRSGNSSRLLRGRRRRWRGRREYRRHWSWMCGSHIDDTGWGWMPRRKVVHPNLPIDKSNPEFLCHCSDVRGKNVSDRSVVGFVPTSIVLHKANKMESSGYRNAANHTFQRSIEVVILQRSKGK